MSAMTLSFATEWASERKREWRTKKNLRNSYQRFIIPRKWRRNISKLRMDVQSLIMLNLLNTFFNPLPPKSNLSMSAITLSFATEWASERKREWRTKKNLRNSYQRFIIPRKWRRNISKLGMDVQYGSTGFQAGGTKLEIFLHKNQHT